jgi:hypothetical protein
MCTYKKSRGSVDGASSSARRMLDAQIEVTRTWDEVYDVCYADLCTHGKQLLLGVLSNLL